MGKKKAKSRPAGDSSDWLSTNSETQEARQKICLRIKEAIKPTGFASRFDISGEQIEQSLFDKCRTREEYLALAAKLILHMRDGSSRQLQLPGILDIKALLTSGRTPSPPQPQPMVIATTTAPLISVSNSPATAAAPIQTTTTPLTASIRNPSEMRDPGTTLAGALQAVRRNSPVSEGKPDNYRTLKHSCKDTILLKRIKQILAAKNYEPQDMDADELVEELISKHREYQRKKRGAFTKFVGKVLDELAEQGGVSESKGGGSFGGDSQLSQLERKHLLKRKRSESCSSDDSDDFDSGDNPDSDFSVDNQSYTIYQDSNSVNNSLTALYKQRRKGTEPATTTAAATKLTTSTCNGEVSALERERPLPASTTTSSANTAITAALTSGAAPTRIAPAVTVTTALTYANKSAPPTTNQSNSEEKHDLTPQEEEKEKPAEKQKVKKKRLRPASSKESAQHDQPFAKKHKKVVELEKSPLRFSDIGGIEKSLYEICKLVSHMRHPEVAQQLGVTPPRGLLLHGPPGCGKTLLAHAIAGELDMPFMKVGATEMVSGISGESEENIRDVFEQAKSCAPCVLFLDEIDAITPKRETAQREMERRIVTQLQICMDELNKSSSQVFVLGATNRVDSLDTALRRAGRFDREIALGMPDKEARYKILQVLCRGLKLEEDFDYTHLANQTPGYVGADLMSLCREAAFCAMDRVLREAPAEASTANNSNVETAQGGLAANEETAKGDRATNEEMALGGRTANEETAQEDSTATTANQIGAQPEGVPGGAEPGWAVALEGPPDHQAALRWLGDQPPLSDLQLQKLCIRTHDFTMALGLVQPSAKREGFATVPDVTWNDVGAMESFREELTMSILAPVRNPAAFRSLGLTNPQGILLTGPPGCGKTLLAKAIANESGINFISVKGPELLDKYLGESERAVRQMFQRAKNSAPCVIFIDEIDSLCKRRDAVSDSGSISRVVNQFLTEMDGLEARKQVFVIGATNRADMIDPAMLRPGRFDKTLHVGIPSPQDRVKILHTVTKNGTVPRLAPDVSLDDLGNDPRCKGFTGADLASLVREAAMTALRRVMGASSLLAAPAAAAAAGAGASASTPATQVTREDFETAFTKVTPSVSLKDQLMYEQAKAKHT